MVNEMKKLMNKNFSDTEILNLVFYATIIIMPFIVIKETQSKYNMGKLAYLYVVGLFLVVMLIKMIFQKNIKLCKFIEYKIIGIFLLSLCIATGFSINYKVSILGNTTRFEGLIIYFIYIGLFLFATTRFIISKKGIELFSISATLMAIYTILQLIGIDPVYDFMVETSKGKETFGLIGHRNFLSTYLIIAILLTLSIYFFYNKKRYFIYSSIIFAGLISTFTRGGWVAFFIVSIMALLLIGKEKEQLKKALMVFITFTIIFFTINFISGERVLSRTESIIRDGKNISESSGSGRVEIWQMTLKSLKNQWIIGTGLDTLHLRLIRDCPEQFIEIIPKIGGYPDKAHNEFLEYWACGGILTLISYLALIVVILINLLKRIHENKAKVLLLMIIGYLIQSFFNISVIQVAPIYWILLGVAVNYYRNNDKVTFSKKGIL